MATKYAQIPQDIQDAISTNAGIILSDFNPKTPATADEIRENILFATTGGVSVTCAMTVSDYGADIDNCPKNTKEMARVDGWECRMSGTALTIKDGADAARLFGAAESTTDGDVDMVKPKHRFDVDADFNDLWFVCPYGVSGGFVAIHLSNAINTGGFSLKSSDDGKGQYPFDFLGHTSIDNPEVVPFTFYLKKSDAAALNELNL